MKQPREESGCTQGRVPSLPYERTIKNADFSLGRDKGLFQQEKGFLVEGKLAENNLGSER